MTMTRRQALKHATAFGAVLAWPSALLPREAKGAANERAARPASERRDLFPQGVASGDPYPDSVVLWTRRPPVLESRASALAVEVAEDPAFARVVSRAVAHLAAEADWTCRVLAAGLKPSRVYWYRFVDEHGFASRTGRTLTAPAPDDRRLVRFAFVSCQNVTQGASNAYRRMIWEDERAAEADRLGFVLHLGDFVYEVVWYPEDRPQGMYDRRIRDVVRYPTGEKIQDFHVPTDVADYRTLYRGYLTDPDLQDARARWPFVCMWDNHEFSWRGWQSQQNFGGVRPAQTRKVAAAQAWFEYQPARVERPGAPAVDRGSDRFWAPAVRDVPIERFDDHGLGLEPGNLAAIGSLKLYRALRFGSNVELILTDNRSYRSEPIGDRPESGAFEAEGFPYFESQDVAEILDAGRTFDGGRPPATIAWGGAQLPNPRRAAPPQSMLGAEQKGWFLGRLRDSTARWRLWGNSVGMVDWRADLQNLPPGAGPKWPGAGYGLMGGGDWSSYRAERAEILDFVRRERLAGFASLGGDRHAFSAGRISTSLPPRPFEPVGIEFIVGSISAPGLFEAATHKIGKSDPLRPLFLHDPPAPAAPEPAINFTLRHGVRASLELQRTHDREKALALHNPEVAPHLDFVDLGGHGYAVVRASADDLEVEFVCVVRPLERSDRPDGGPLAYRVAHRVARWDPRSSPATAPRLQRARVEGELPLSV
jgi:alkaline phosphatase D